MPERPSGGSRLTPLARQAYLQPTPVSIDERLHGLVPGSCCVDWQRN